MSEKKTILLVDDDSRSLKLIEAIFVNEGYITLTADDGLQAFKLLHEVQVDVVLTDVLMPNVDGYYLLYKIRQEPRLADIPVIVYTATYASKSEEKVAEDMGADLFIRKPAAKSVLVNAVQKVLNEPVKKKELVLMSEGTAEVMHQYSSELVNKLEQRNIELEEIRKGLEQTVNLRTQELQTTNEELMAANEELQASLEELSVTNEKLHEANELIQKQAAVILRQKEEKLNHVLDASSDVIWSQDLTDTNQNYISRSAERITGIPINQFENDFNLWIEAVVPQDREIKVAAFLSSNDRKSRTCTYRIADTQGNVHWLQETIRLEFDEHNNPIRRTGIATEITKLKEAELKAESERNLLRSIIDNIPDYIFVKDQALKHTINNRAFLDTLGAETEAETLGKTAVDYFGEIAGNFVEEDLKVITEGISIINKPELGFNKGKERIPILTTKVPFRNSNHEIIGLIGIIRDITTYKQQEQVLQEYREKLEIIFSNTREEILLLDASGRVVLFNDALLNFLTKATGKQPQVGEYLWDVSLTERQVTAKALFQRALRGEEIFNEATLTMPDGSKVVHELHYEPIYIDDQVKYVVVISLDVTDQRKNEKRLQESRSLLHTAFEMASMGYWSYHPKQKMFYCFGLTSTLLGVKSREISLDEYLSAIYSDDRKWVEETLETVIQQHESCDLEYRIQLANDTVRWLHLRINATTTETGALIVLGVVQDITERKGIEEILREYNERFECVSKATNDAIWDWDIEHDFEIWNHGLETIFGYDETTHLNPGAWKQEVIHPEDYPTIKKDREECFSAHQNLWSGSYRIRCADGSYKHVLDRAYIIYKNNNPVRMIGAMQDITQQREALQEIEKLSLVASKITNAVLITDPEGRLEWANDAFTQLTGYTLPEVMGLKPGSFLQGPETDPESIGRISVALNSRQPISEELVNYTKAGEKHWVRMDITPVLSANNQAVHFIAVTSDITDQKKFEARITAIARELTDLMENANVPIFGVDRTGCLNEWNKVAAEVSGFSKAEVLGKKWEQFILPHMHRVVARGFEQLAEGNQVPNYELPFVSKAGKRVVFLVSASPRRDINNQVVGAICVAQDITEVSNYRVGLERMVEVRTRELNMALQKEKELVEMKSKFVSIASHEFRTPLASISMSAGFIEKYLERMSANDIQQKIGIIHKQVNHMTSLMDDILTVGKAEAGKITVSIKPVNVYEFIHQLVEDVHSATHYTHTIKVYFAEEGIKINTDEKLMRNILINLLNNAIKFSPGAGQVYLKIYTDGFGIHLNIQDFGIGIPQDDVKNLFQSFQRGSNVHTIPGTGLGLSIVKKAVDLLHGTITVQSQPGNGATFTVFLPFID